MFLELKQMILEFIWRNDHVEITNREGERQKQRQRETEREREEGGERQRAQGQRDGSRVGIMGRGLMVYSNI